MSGNGFGTIFRFTTFGESHGEAIGCLVEGVPSRIPLVETDIQTALDRRRPGQSAHTTPRKESDTVRILSGVFNGVTTGTPIGLLIRNENQASAEYEEISDKYRPAHADMAYDLKYGIRDYRGGGRASARETAMRVAAGAVAGKVLEHFIKTPFSINAGIVQIGEERIDYTNWQTETINTNSFFCPDPSSVSRFEKLLTEIRNKGSSVGAVIEIRATGFPAGLGEPVYDKLDADIAKALMSINAAKGIEIGAGFAAACMTGEEDADEMYADEDSLTGIGFLSNQAGGILGGLSTGQPIIARLAVKPTPSILTPLKTVTKDLKNTTISTEGRHDPCVGIRAVPVAEAMMSCVLADHLLRYRSQYA